MNALPLLLAIGLATPQLPAIWEVKVVGVYDGDTIRVDVPQMPEPLNHMKVRVRGIDTPELGA
jgi:endonuclease YncB( thermonuclease family)